MQVTTPLSTYLLIYYRAFMVLHVPQYRILNGHYPFFLHDVFAWKVFITPFKAQWLGLAIKNYQQGVT
jgi:hypothetical protein